MFFGYRQNCLHNSESSLSSTTQVADTVLTQAFWVPPTLPRQFWLKFSSRHLNCLFRFDLSSLSTEEAAHTVLTQVLGYHWNCLHSVDSIFLSTAESPYTVDSFFCSSSLSATGTAYTVFAQAFRVPPKLFKSWKFLKALLKLPTQFWLKFLEYHLKCIHMLFRILLNTFETAYTLLNQAFWVPPKLCPLF